ncbi:MAG: transporter permease subunit, partial [Steroidobacteraceae bacterium]|nr:transporter permease subunit [Steroidobacteraceae bacterium]
LRYRWVLLGIVVALWLAALKIEPLRHYPESWTLSTGVFWDDLVEWLNVNYFDSFEAVKTAILLKFMIPVKRFLLAQPWPFVLFCVMAAALSIAGLRRAVIAGVFVLTIVFTGLWQPAIVSVYLTGVSVLLAVAMGVPIGIASGTRPRLWKFVEVMIDTLQTLPSFVYLIPVVMLFRVGDFTAMFAIILYALAPAIRYTALGIREVDPGVIEAATAMGATRMQIMLRIRLPLALPSILLGINQTIMLALSMLVITALVGTRDLGRRPRPDGWHRRRHDRHDRRSIDDGFGGSHEEEVGSWVSRAPQLLSPGFPAGTDRLIRSRLRAALPTRISASSTRATAISSGSAMTFRCTASCGQMNWRQISRRMRLG